MEDEFSLPVHFNNKEWQFHGKLLKYGYTYKIEIDVNGTKVLFERDEERNWRALISYEDIQANKQLDARLLERIALELGGNTLRKLKFKSRKS